MIESCSHCSALLCDESRCITCKPSYACLAYLETACCELPAIPLTLFHPLPACLLHLHALPVLLQLLRSCIALSAKIPVAPLPLYLPWLVARRDFSTVVVAKLVTKIKNQGDVDTLLDPSHRRVLRQALAIGLEFAFHKSVQVQGKPKRQWSQAAACAPGSLAFEKQHSKWGRRRHRLE